MIDGDEMQQFNSPPAASRQNKPPAGPRKQKFTRARDQNVRPRGKRSLDRELKHVQLENLCKHMIQALNAHKETPEQDAATIAEQQQGSNIEAHPQVVQAGLFKTPAPVVSDSPSPLKRVKTDAMGREFDPVLGRWKSPNAWKAAGDRFRQQRAQSDTVADEPNKENDETMSWSFS